MFSMITVYSPSETDFSHNGLVPLLPAACSVTETINGAYELTLAHPIDSSGRWRAVNELSVVRAQTPSGEPQLFRIYKISKNLNNTLTAYGRHIFYDGLYDFIPALKFTGLIPDEAMKRIDAARTVMPGKFSVSSDLPGTADLDFTDTDPVAAMLDSDGIVNKTGGELLRDNFKIKLTAAIGSDRGVQIRYRKNLTGLDFTSDVSKTVTRVKPAASGKDGDLLLPEIYVDSPFIGNYPFPLVDVLNCSDIRVGDDYTTETARAEMRRRADKFFLDGNDLPAVNAKISFADLRKTEEYRDYAALKTVSPGDTVTVIHELLGVNIKAKVIKYTFNCLLGRYENIELGKPLGSLAYVIGDAEAAFSIASRAERNAASAQAGIGMYGTQIQELYGRVAALEAAGNTP